MMERKNTFSNFLKFNLFPARFSKCTIHNFCHSFNPTWVIFLSVLVWHKNLKFIADKTVYKCSTKYLFGKTLQIIIIIVVFQCTLLRLTITVITKLMARGSLRKKVSAFWSECRKMRTRIISNTDTFHAVDYNYTYAIHS